MNALNPPLLELKDVTKSFGGVMAVEGVGFKIFSSEIIALIGPNGAGKTTVFNLVTGVFPPTAGEIFFEGQKINNLKPFQIAQLGIARTFQNLQLFTNMQVIENVMIGAHGTGKAGIISSALALPWVAREDKNMEAKALQYLESVGLKDKAYEKVDNLPFGQQRLTEIARALASEAKLIILDEPAAGLNASETSELIQLIRELRSNDKTILLVEHDMDTVMTLADRIIVLDFGVKIGEGTPHEIQNNAKVIKAYLGEDEEDA